METAGHGRNRGGWSRSGSVGASQTVDQHVARTGLVIAKKRHSGHVAGTSAYPPTGDIRWPMSVFVLISSALPPAADILDKAGNVSS